MKTLHYYFGLISPFTYLGHDEFMEIVDRADVNVEFHPIKFGAVFAATGGVPPAKRSPQRQALRFQELRRWSARKGIPLNLELMLIEDGTLAGPGVPLPLPGAKPKVSHSVSPAVRDRVQGSVGVGRWWLLAVVPARTGHRSAERTERS